MDFKVEESSGNVFEDLNLSNPEERVAKAEICIQIRRAIQSRKLTQLQAAKLLGLEQSKVSLLMNGRVCKSSKSYGKSKFFFKKVCYSYIIYA